MSRIARFTLFLFVALVAALAQANPLSQVPLPNEGPVHKSDSWTYANCGSESDVVQIRSIVVSPDPPQPGQNLTVTVKANVATVVEDGAYVDVTVKIGRIKLLHRRIDVCEEARNANATVQCPIQPDDYEVTETIALPKEIPRAKFMVNVRGYTVDEDDMVCLDLAIDFMKHPFPKFGWY